MRVALVADTFSVLEGTGIARYAQELLAGLSRRGVDAQGICPETPRLPFGAALNHAFKMPHSVQSTARAFDVIHATSPITALAFPIVSRPKVVTYHDLVSLLGTENSSGFHTRLFAPVFLRIGRYADRVIANSSQTKSDIVTHLGIAPDRVTVTNWGVSNSFKPKRTAERGFVIGYVGALGRRKALPYLIRALHHLVYRYPDIPWRLAICGRRTLEYDNLARMTVDLGLSEAVEFRGAVPDAKLVDAYNSFDVFAFPSESEGFGLPILEAQRCGVPVVVRSDARIPHEVSRYCAKATSEDDMADKLHALLTDGGLRQPLIEQGLKYSRGFSWDRTVDETLEVYEQAVCC